MSVKTAIIVSDYAYVEGGASQIAIQTATLLAQKGLSVHFFAAVGPIASELTCSTVKVTCLGLKDILHNSNRIAAMISGIQNAYVENRFENFLKSFNPNFTIIHIHTWTKSLSSVIFKVASKMHFQTLITVHDYFLICPNGGLYNYKTNCDCQYKPLSFSCLTSNCDSRHYFHKIWRVLRQLMQNCFTSSSNIGLIFISHFSEMEFHKRTFRGALKYFLPNVIDFKKKEIIKAYNNNYFVFIGRLAEEKGIRLFCNAVSDTGVDAIVIGDGQLRTELENKYGNNIRFVGWLSHSEIENVLLKTRCLVFTSQWYETFGLTVLETQVRGIPCIVPNQCSACELIEDNKNALVFLKGNIDDLKEKILRMKDDKLVKRLSQSSYWLFKYELYSSENYVANLCNIYNKHLQKIK